MQLEIYRTVKDFPDYEVSNYGTIKSWKFIASGGRKHPRYLKGSKGSKLGHLKSNISQNGRKRGAWIHILVLETFGPPKPSPLHQCAHIDGNPRNNYIGNLKWATPIENENDKITHGTRKTDPNNPIFKKRMSLGLKQTEFAELLGEKQAQISRWERGAFKPKKGKMEKINSL